VEWIDVRVATARVQSFLSLAVTMPIPNEVMSKLAQRPASSRNRQPTEERPLPEYTSDQEGNLRRPPTITTGGLAEAAEQASATGGRGGTDGDLRMLGAVDGYAHALVRLRQEIGSINYRGIYPHHVRKLAVRDDRLKSLRSIEAWLVDRHTKTRDAYEKTIQK
jgi:hypothetical protein